MRTSKGKEMKNDEMVRVGWVVIDKSGSVYNYSHGRTKRATKEKFDEVNQDRNYKYYEKIKKIIGLKLIPLYARQSDLKPKENQ